MEAIGYSVIISIWGVFRRDARRVLRIEDLQAVRLAMLYA